MDSRELLQAIVIDRAHSIPLHHQLFLELRRLIIQERITPGTGLPQVSEIGRALGFSTITITRAIAELKREGLVVTRRGVGIFVAERPIPATEVVVSFPVAASLSPGQFLFPLVEGIRKGLEDSRRRCVVTYFDEQPPSVQEIRDLMRSRRADSMVLFRPKPALLQAVRLLPRDFATVLVFEKTPGWAGDCVLAAPEPAVKRFLADRLAAGRRRFAYLGKLELQKLDEESPYRKMAEAFRSAMAGAGLEAPLHFEPSPVYPPGVRPPPGEVEKVLAGKARQLETGTVVVADTPHVAAEALAANPGLELAAYTEATFSLEQFRGRMNLIYCDLDRAGSLAARLLKERLADPKLQPRTLALEAEWMA